MATNVNTIVLAGFGHHEEGVADAAISPGEAVRMAADGKYDPETLAPALAAGLGLKIAKEDGLQGNPVTEAYAQNDRLFFYNAQPGDRVHALVKLGEDIDVGDLLAVEGSGSGKFVEVASSSVADYPFPLTSGKVHDAMQTALPGTAANDDMGLITGTPGTDAPTLQGVDFGGASSDEKGAFEFVLPPEYRAGAAVTIRARAAILTTIADDDCLLDVEAWKDAGDGAVGSDLCTTAAQDMNSLTPANLDFTITPTGLIPGDRLIIRLSIDGTDAGNLGVMIPEISKVAARIGNAIAAQLEAYEDSGGALAAAGLIKCRVLNT